MACNRWHPHSSTRRASPYSNRPSSKKTQFFEERNILIGVRNGENLPIAGQISLSPSISLVSLRIMSVHMLVLVESEAQADKYANSSISFKYHSSLSKAMSVTYRVSWFIKDKPNSYGNPSSDSSSLSTSFPEFGSSISGLVSSDSLLRMKSMK